MENQNNFVTLSGNISCVVSFLYSQSHCELVEGILIMTVKVVGLMSVYKCQSLMEIMPLMYSIWCQYSAGI